MALTDPQSITIAGVAVSLPRVSSSGSSSVYQSADGNTKLTVTSSTGRRYRRTARLEHKKIAGDPLVPATNTTFSMSCYVTYDVPPVGYTVAQQKEVGDGLTSWLASGTGAANSTTKILGGES